MYGYTNFGLEKISNNRRTVYTICTIRDSSTRKDHSITPRVCFGSVYVDLVNCFCKFMSLIFRALISWSLTAKTERNSSLTKMNSFFISANSSRKAVSKDSHKFSFHFTQRRIAYEWCYSLDVLWEGSMEDLKILKVF